MKRYLLSAALALAAAFVIPAYAASGLTSDSAAAAGFNKLSETEKAEILKTIAAKAQANNTDLASIASAAANPEQVDQWLNVGEKVGKMIGGAAKEVGVAVNDFIHTPVGLTAMALIVWHYMGDMVVHVFGGLLVLAVGLSFILYYARKYTRTETIYDTDKQDIFGRSVVKVVNKSKWEGETVAGFMGATAVVIGAALIVMFTF